MCKNYLKIGLKLEKYCNSICMFLYVNIKRLIYSNYVIFLFYDYFVWYFFSGFFVLNMFQEDEVIVRVIGDFIFG